MATLQEKLTKLKKLAESERSIGNVDAAENFAAMLQNLLIKHKLSMSELEICEDEIDMEWMDFSGYGIPSTSRRSFWKETLAGVVAKAYGCQIMVQGKSNRLGIIGKKSNRDIAEYTILTLMREANKMADYHYVAIYQKDRLAAKGFKKSFIDGFITRISQRLKKDNPEQETGLIVLNQDFKQTQDWITKKSNLRPSSKIGKTTAQFNPDAYGKGIATANKMDLGGQALGGGNNQGQQRIQ